LDRTLKTEKGLSPLSQDIPYGLCAFSALKIKGIKPKAELSSARAELWAQKRNIPTAAERRGIKNPVFCLRSDDMSRLTGRIILVS